MYLENEKAKKIKIWRRLYKGLIVQAVKLSLQVLPGTRRMAHLPALSIRVAFLDLLRQTASSAAPLEGGNGKGEMSEVDTGFLQKRSRHTADLLKKLQFFQCLTWMSFVDNYRNCIFCFWNAASEKRFLRKCDWVSAKQDVLVNKSNTGSGSSSRLHINCWLIDDRSV